MNTDAFLRIAQIHPSDQQHATLACGHGGVTRAYQAASFAEPQATAAVVQQLRTAHRRQAGCDCGETVGLAYCPPKRSSAR